MNEIAKALTNYLVFVIQKAKIDKGGPGSGNWAHAGRPGSQGGSQSSSGAAIGSGDKGDGGSAGATAKKQRENDIEAALDRIDAKGEPKGGAELAYWRQSYDLLPVGTEGVKWDGTIATIKRGTEITRTSMTTYTDVVNFAQWEETNRRGKRVEVTKNIAAEAFEPLNPKLSYRLNSEKVTDFKAVNKKLGALLRQQSGR